MIEVLTCTGSHWIDQPEEAIAILKTLPPTSVRLDYHGVLDILPFSESLPEGHSYCTISYVGLNGEKHHQTKSELLERIQKGQILFAVLVFRKGYKRKEKRAYTVPGSKAWVNAHLLEVPGKSTYFIDDHKEHLMSTQLLCPHIHCKQYSKSECNLICWISSFLGKEI